MAKKALCLIRNSPHYRQEAFLKGLARSGYSVSISPVGFKPEPGDLLIIWNRYGIAQKHALQFERAGARVCVVENGYTGEGYAISEKMHNGGGYWPKHQTPRKHIVLEPWRETGREAVILPQRGIGCPPVAQPAGWLEWVRKQDWGIRTRVRAHPGTRKCVPLLEDLKNAKFIITWASGAGVKAIIAGIPVVYCYVDWIGAKGASMNQDKLFRGDRTEFLSDITWSEWTVDEIIKGEPFEYFSNR